jgi:hypothetical protein
MDKQYHFLKKPYLPPRLVSVSFQVELGSGVSGGVLPAGFLIESFGTTNNSGEGFWGNTSTSASGFSNEGYSTFNSNGESGGWVW